MKNRIILLKPYNNLIFYNNNIFKINDGSNIFYKFRKNIKNYGIDIKTIDFIDEIEPEKIIYCDVPYPWQVKEWITLIKNRKKNILITFESPLINPFSYMPVNRLFFKVIYTWNIKLQNHKKYNMFVIPQLDSGLNQKEKSFKSKKFLTIINSNKRIPVIFRIFSLGYKDLYKERLRAIRFFEKNYPHDFYLFGRGWNRKKYPSYKGIVSNKIDTLSNFKYSICFENTNADGYITEKIFDCFKARCVPVYYGTSNINKFIPEKCYIDYRDYMDYEKLYNYLNDMTEKEYKLYIEEIEKFLYNKKTQSSWFEKGFQRFFLRIVGEE